LQKEAVKRKSEAVEADATAEKIAKLKETAAEVVAEVSTISFYSFLMAMGKIINSCFIGIFAVRILFCHFLRQLGVENIKSNFESNSVDLDL
jgi:hypothetical protein